MLYHNTSVSCDPVQFFGPTTGNQLAPALVVVLEYYRSRDIDLRTLQSLSELEGSKSWPRNGECSSHLNTVLVFTVTG